eukprot:TRINITY_DN5192_c0_g1_i1.p1 TRINITY_DN5192_c0_g1~~TRINITY_DN5192_c0_g1_i1.p1  ORF type:complete len:56 (+),score=1.31 TRINITY_DN5192_c0_g1_i1:48-215(+)
MSIIEYIWGSEYLVCVHASIVEETIDWRDCCYRAKEKKENLSSSHCYRSSTTLIM